MAKVKHIIVHCSDSIWGCVREIRKWHQARRWYDIGYHFVILNGHVGKKMNLPVMNGHIECGRFLDQDLSIDGKEIGAHALGYNKESIGICLIGKDQFTSRQIKSLMSLCTELMQMYSLTVNSIMGHYETESSKRLGKTCPNINMDFIRDSFSF